MKTHLAAIPGELTSQLQPLDVSVNKPFKGFTFMFILKDGWTEKE